MDICNDLKHIQHFDKSVLTIGSLDGMHRGHMEIISALIAMSKSNHIPSVVVTFDPHPKMILNKSVQRMQQLLIIDKKIELLKNIDYVWIIPFNKEFSHLSAGEFLKKYITAYFNPTHIIIGYDHRFGFNREGDADFLNNNKKAYGYNLHIEKPLFYHDMPISSSRIRSYLQCGDIDAANECLSREYEISGIIVKGRGVGTELGFPTANIQPLLSNQLIPAHGVYCVDAIIEDSYYTGMCNIGRRPTYYDHGEEVIEVHLFSNDVLNLNGKAITLRFKKYLREERKYNSSSELTIQLKLDRQACFAL